MRLGVSLAFGPFIVAGICGVCVWVRILHSFDQSWLGFVVCVLGCQFVFTPPVLARVCGVCVWVRVLPSPRHSWLGFLVFLCRYGFPLHPANPGRDVACGCLCVGSACTPPVLAEVCC